VRAWMPSWCARTTVATAFTSTGTVVSTVTRAPIPTGRSYSAMASGPSVVTTCHRMSDAGVVPLESESGRAGTVHLDGPRGQAGQLCALVLAAGPEVRLDHHGRSVGR